MIITRYDSDDILGTDSIIDRNIENLVFSCLSSLNRGMPIFYGLFINGRVESYIDAKAMTPEEMSSTRYLNILSSSIANFHTLDIQNLSRSRFLWPKMSEFFKIAQSKYTVCIVNSTQSSILL